MSVLLQISCVLISWYTSEEMEGRKLVKIGGKWVKMGENGWKWVKMGENGWKLGENWKFHFYAFLVIFCHFGWFQAILVHFVQFVKGVVPLLKGDGQLVQGADSLKLLSKLAVFPLLLISAKFWPNFFGIFPKCSIFWKLLEKVLKFGEVRNFNKKWSSEVRWSSKFKFTEILICNPAI